MYRKKCIIKNFSCRPVRYFGMLIWDDITLFWDENVILFTFLTGNWEETWFSPIRILFMFYYNKFSSQNKVISSQNNV